MNTKLIELGFCTKPHGIKGEFSFNLINGVDSVLKKGMELLLIPSSEKSSIALAGETFKIKKIQFGNKVIAELVGVSDRNLVEGMIPFNIWLDRRAFPKLEEGEIYLNDLVGFNVLSDLNDDLGIVTALGSNGVQDIIRIEQRNGEILEILFLDQFIKEVNLEEGTLTICLPEMI